MSAKLFPMFNMIVQSFFGEAGVWLNNQIQLLQRPVDLLPQSLPFLKPGRFLKSDLCNVTQM